MKLYTTINSQPNQRFYVITDDAKQVEIHLYFLPTQESWYMDLTCEDFSVNGIKIVRYPNILDKYRNLITFGINISTEDGLDPWRITDFSDGYASFILLNKDDVKDATRFLDGE
jgi:hypothetical protein